MTQISRHVRLYKPLENYKLFHKYVEYSFFRAIFYGKTNLKEFYTKLLH